MEPSPAELRHLRAVDWRFLLPELTPRRVAVVAPDGAPWADAAAGGLEAAGYAVTRTAPERLPGLSPSDREVVVSGDRRSTEVAGVVAPSTLVVRAPDRTFSRPGVDRAVGRLVRRSGGRHVLRAVQWPPRGAPTELMPVIGGGAADYLLRRRTGPVGKVSASLMSVLAVPLLPILPTVSIVSEARPAAALLGLLDPIPRHWLLVTPQFAASRHVVLCADDGASRAPSRVAKVARVRGDPSVGREADVLRAAARCAGVGAVDIPAVLHEAALDGHPALVESWVHGDLLDPRRVRERPRVHVERVTAWLRALVVGEAPLDGARWEHLVAEPLERLDGMARAVQLPSAGALADRVRQAVQELRGARLPVAVEHGDLGHPNLLVTPAGEIGVVDWELGRSEGLGLVDLAFFLSWVAAAVTHAETHDAHAAAVDRRILRGSHWLRRMLLAEAARLGLPEAVVDRLVLICWLTHATRPYGTGPGREPDVETARRAWAHRHRLLLELSLRATQ